VLKTELIDTSDNDSDNKSEFESSGSISARSGPLREDKKKKSERVRWRASIGDTSSHRREKDGRVPLESSPEKKRPKSPRKFLNKLKNQAKKLSPSLFHGNVSVANKVDNSEVSDEGMKSDSPLLRMLSNSSSIESGSDNPSLIMTTSETDIWINQSIFTGKG